MTNLSDSHSWHLTHHGLPPEAEQRRGDQSAPFFGSDDKEIREFITANFSAQLKRADIGRHLGLLAKRVSQTRRPESQRADSGDVGDIVAQVNEVHLSESNHDRVQELLEASAGWEFNSLDLVGPTNNHALLFLGYWIFVQERLPSLFGIPHDTLLNFLSQVNKG